MWSLFPILTLRVGTGIVSILVEKWVWVESGPPSVAEKKNNNNDLNSLPPLDAE